MKRLLASFLLCTLTLPALCQHISVSPTSFVGIGKIKHVTELSIGYKSFAVHYFYTAPNHRWKIYKEKLYRQSPAVAISVKPGIISRVLAAGVLVSPSGIPFRNSSMINFVVDIGYRFSSLRISYSHISNGFGLSGKLNPGLDSIKATYYF